MKKLSRKIAVVCLALVCSLAQAQYAGTDYTTQDARRAMPAQLGVIIDVVSSNLDVEASGLSRTVGATAGGLVCAAGSRRIADWGARAAVIGLCGLASERISSAVGAESRRTSTLIVRTDDSRVFSVMQEDPTLRVGSRVYVLSGGNATRVVLSSSSFQR